MGIKASMKLLGVAKVPYKSPGAQKKSRSIIIEFLHNSMLTSSCKRNLQSDAGIIPFTVITNKVEH